MIYAIALVGIGSIVASANSDDIKRAPKFVNLLDDLEAVCLFLHSSEQWQREARSDPQKFQEAVEKCQFQLTQFKPKQNTLAAATLQYYEGRLYALAGKQELAYSAFRRGLGNGVVAPECLFAMSELVNSRQDHLRHHSFLGAILPTSLFRKLFDHMELGAVGELPMIPITSDPFNQGPKSLAIADLFRSMLMNEEARNAYMEHIYCLWQFVPASPNDVLKRMESSWLSHESSSIWLKLAELEWQSGNISDFSEFLAKSIAFGTNRDKHAGLKFLAQCRKEGQIRHPPKPQIDSNKILEIARLYTEMNLHPRAINLLRKYKAELPESAQSILKGYEKQWTELMERYTAHVIGRCTLFGYNVMDRKNWLKMEIPPPCSEEALAVVQEELKLLK